jgi:hypothetical protein
MYIDHSIDEAFIGAVWQHRHHLNRIRRDQRHAERLRQSRRNRDTDKAINNPYSAAMKVFKLKFIDVKFGFVCDVCGSEIT